MVSGSWQFTNGIKNRGGMRRTPHSTPIFLFGQPIEIMLDVR